MIRAPNEIKKIVNGIFEDTPSISLTFLIFIHVVSTPADRNNMIFPNAWNTRCNTAAKIDNGAKIETDKTIYDS
tara:strand:+ start:445 stop:666 length:222 start_codon:yes stop_codon:yes gene_type:complete